VPVTVLSRCQRFDLRRGDAAVVIAHLEGIAKKEKIKVEPEALRMIARAAEGSVRDALSILDQAIAHGAGKVEASAVEGMLGLADRARIVDLFEHVMRGDAAAALTEIAAQHEAGADPATVLTDLADFCHYVTRLKLAPTAASNAAISETERTRGAAFAEKLSLRDLARAFQMLLKGIEEVGLAPRPMVAAEMVLVRLCHAADLPTPDEAIRMIGDGGGSQRTAHLSGRPAPSGAGSSGGRVQAAARIETQPVALEPAKPVFAPRSFEDLLTKAKLERDRLLVFALERHIRPVRFEPGKIEISLTEDAEPGLPQKLMHALKAWTGERWLVAVSQAEAGETFHEIRQRSAASLIDEARADPLVQKVLARFPGAEIVGVREKVVEAEPDHAAEPPVDPDEAERAGEE
jgi:DNA polymerase-3 subunit gamma/tau